jgi:predicted transcriptional regulator
MPSIGYLKGFVENYFSNSYRNMVSFFSKNEDLSIKEIEEIIRVLQDQVDSKNQNKEN